MPSPNAFLLEVDGRTEVFFDPHPKQAEIRQILWHRLSTGEGPSKFFLRGNRGGGKSYLIRKGFLHAVALAFPGIRYAVVRRNMPDLRANHLIYLGSEMRKLGGTFHETHGIAFYPEVDGKQSMGFYRQCETSEDVEKVVGAEVHIIFIDEAPQIKWEHQRTISPSVRVASKPGEPQPYYAMEIYSGNPMGESIEEMDKYFLDQDVSELEDPDYNPKDWCHIPIHLQDNPSLDEKEYRKQFAGLPAHFRAAWIDGVRMDSRRLFDVKPTKDDKPYHYIQELPSVGGIPLLKVPWVQVYRAFDMGYFPDPAVCVWLAVVGRRVIAFHEQTWFRTIAKDLAQAMQETTQELLGEDRVVMTYVDPQIHVKTGSDTVTVMDTLELNGVPCEPSINDRVLYADAIHGLLGEEVEPGVPRFQVYEPGCPMLAKYLPKMRWDENNPRKMANHQFDHWVVALAYFAISSGILSLSEKVDNQPEPFWKAWMREEPKKKRKYA